jgi:hypothetical protein
VRKRTAALRRGGGRIAANAQGAHAKWRIGATKNYIKKLTSVPPKRGRAPGLWRPARRGWRRRKLPLLLRLAEV